MGTRLLLVIFCALSLSSPVLSSWEEFAEEIKRMDGNRTADSSLLRANYLRASKAVGLKNFPCSPSLLTRSHNVASSVHELGPSDIKVIGALGDSLTAGNGAAAFWILQVLTEYRGLSWSVGGDKRLEEVTTLPNILRKFNPDLNGQSFGKGPVREIEKSHLNVAVPGSTASAMLDQATVLIDRMKNNPNIDFLNDWKMVTLFVGGNDLCDWIKDNDRYSAENYVAHIKAALDLLHSEMPRTFVNLIQVADVIQLAGIKGFGCKALRLYLCPSAIFSKTRATKVLADYRRGLSELTQSGRYDTKDDFTVVLQPMYEDTRLPRMENSNEVDTSYFAPDCFHFSGKAHAAAAKALWNNLLEPVGKKTDSFEPSKELQLKCPNEENPHFYTSKNSQPKALLLKSAGSPQNAAFQAAAAATDDDTETHDEDANSKTSSPGVAIAVGVVGGLMVIACVVMAVVVTVRRRKSRGSEQAWLFESASPRA